MGNRFSERLGMVQPRSVMQGRSLDRETRSRLWSVLATAVPIHGDPQQSGRRTYTWENTWMGELYRHVWADHFRDPVDEIPDDEVAVRARLKAVFLEGEWYSAYELLEFVQIGRAHV